MVVGALLVKRVRKFLDCFGHDGPGARHALRFLRVVDVVPVARAHDVAVELHLLQLVWRQALWIKGWSCGGQMPYQHKQAEQHEREQQRLSLTWRLEHERFCVHTPSPTGC